MPSATANDSLAVFGIRHLSPAGAWHLRRFLDQVRPSLILVEAMADAQDLIEDVLHPQAQPPLAVLAYTQSLPVRTIVSPLASYSPEYQALVWGQQHGVPVRFCDLPSENFLGLVEKQRARADADYGNDEAEDAEDAEDAAESEPEPLPGEPRASIYERAAELAGEPDYETYWERRFEHNLSPDAYRRQAFEFGRSLRELEEREAGDWAENLVREAYMRRQIEAAVAAGHAPDEIAVVVGAYHAPVIDLALPAMSDEELASLPRAPSKLTLMPYSYFRLSSQSGYGAGNHAPAYFELMWQCLEDEEQLRLPAEFLSRVARTIREGGVSRSTAEVIEGVRLATTLSALNDGLAPTLRDLQDAAMTLIGHGERAAIAEALARVEVGTAIGELPPGVSQTSIQEDFARQTQRLRLDKFFAKESKKQELVLDLRENRHASSEEAAFRDLGRSFFLQRLAFLGVSFAEQAPRQADDPTYREVWHLAWKAEAEIELVEAVLLGETVELAAGFRFNQALANCSSIAEAAALVNRACLCGLPELLEAARQRLQALAVESRDFLALARAAGELGRTLRYGDVRRFDLSPLEPLLGELYLQGALALESAAGCDNQGAQRVYPAMDELNRTGVENDTLVDEETWLVALRRLSDKDDKNPLLSGYACALLLERNLISGDELAREVSRRLSPGIDADLGAGWFEGLSKRNRYALLSRLPLWAQLADYVSSLEEEEFRRALVFLRRAFGDFSPREKRTIAENLAEVWGVQQDALQEVLETPLSEGEQETLDQLNEFDFDDL